MKKIITHTLLSICFLLLAEGFAFAAQPLTNLEELNRHLRETAGKITSIESEFIQTKHIDIFNEDIESRGTFLYCNGKQICLDYHQPIAYRIVINGNRLMTVANGQKNIVNLGSNAMMNETVGAIMPSAPRLSGKCLLKMQTSGILSAMAPNVQLTMVHTVFCIPLMYPFRMNTSVTAI